MEKMALWLTLLLVLAVWRGERASEKPLREYPLTAMTIVFGILGYIVSESFGVAAVSGTIACVVAYAYARPSSQPVKSLDRKAVMIQY